jgi:hypothetical protein
MSCDDDQHRQAVAALVEELWHRVERAKRELAGDGVTPFRRRLLVRFLARAERVLKATRFVQ